MKKAATACVLFIIILIIAGLSQTALDPRDFAGQWYSSKDQSVYLFQEGIIYCSKYTVPLSETEYISGAYSCCRDSVFLFAEGIAGLEAEKELFLVHSGEGSLLCERRDGTGPVYFIRYHDR